MTHHDHIRRVKKLASDAAAWEGQPDPYADAADQQCHVCTCATCGVVNARLRGALVARGWSQSAVHHVRVEGFDFRGGCDPYLAVVKVDSNEVHRAYEDLAELTTEEVLQSVEKVLRRQLC